MPRGPRTPAVLPQPVPEGPPQATQAAVSGTVSPVVPRFGLYLSAVVPHFTGWPRAHPALPWLAECEGMRGPVIGPYDVVLHVSGIAALGGLLENRRARNRGALVSSVVVPWPLRAQHREYGRLLAQARRRRGWWNRRLQRLVSR
jgi:hypothetical protein